MVKKEDKTVVTADELESLQGILKTLSTKLNRFKTDNASLHKLLEEREQTRAAERRQKQIEEYRFTEGEKEDFVETLINEDVIAGIEPCTEDLNYIYYGHWLHENLTEPEKERLKQAVQRCKDEVLAVLNPHVQEPLHSVKKKSSGFKLSRRARVQLGNFSDSD